MGDGHTNFFVSDCIPSGGGNQKRLAWGLAFASIGIFGALAPVAQLVYVRRA